MIQTFPVHNMFERGHPHSSSGDGSLGRVSAGRRILARSFILISQLEDDNRWSIEDPKSSYPHRMPAVNRKLKSCYRCDFDQRVLGLLLLGKPERQSCRKSMSIISNFESWN
eukprot:TRINITY_DN106035_c0_g1_i1.p1 TRINITY_DN106035_c0_g1~~TRINITY_DN106035_c0_g1_i1.p1  ORF type:complete len:112 (+),score=10.54 TRINITY_DN106035_c0_g1_i1:13-348(+)